MVFFHAIYLILRHKHQSLPMQTEVFWISKTNIAGALVIHSSITIDSDCIEMLMRTANGFCSWLLESATSKGCYSVQRCPVLGCFHRQSERADMLTWLFWVVDYLSRCFLSSYCPGLLCSLLLCIGSALFCIIYNPCSMLYV